MFASQNEVASSVEGDKTCSLREAQRHLVRAVSMLIHSMMRMTSGMPARKELEVSFDASQGEMEGEAQLTARLESSGNPVRRVRERMDDVFVAAVERPIVSHKTIESVQPK